MHAALPRLAFALLGLIWGSNFLFMKWAAETVTAQQIVLLRLLFGFLPVLAWALATRALRRSHWRHAHHFLVMSLLAAALYYYAYAHGTALLPSGVAGLLSGAIPLFAFISALLLARSEPLNRRTAGGVALGMVGVTLIARPWVGNEAGIDPEGLAAMLLGSLSVGLSFVYARRFLSPLGIRPIALVTYQLALALTLVAATTDFTGIERLSNDPRALTGLALGLGLAGTGLAFILYYYLVDRLGALAASGATYLPPVVALLIGWLFAGEALNTLDLLALGLILSGVWSLQTGRQAPPTPPAGARAATTARGTA